MIPLEEFRAENNEIRDLCAILDVSVDRSELKDNSIVCELLERFAEKVNAHLAHEDRLVYSDLLKKHTKEADAIADKFLGNTQELKRIFSGYARHWCKGEHSEQTHAKFLQESHQIFRLVCERLDFEEQKIFPVFE